MKIQSIFTLGIIAAAAITIGIIAPLQATTTDDRIESSARNSYVYKTYLGDDAVKIQSKDGAVTLTGRVSEQSHKDMAEDILEDMPGVVSVSNQLKVAAEPSTVRSDAWISDRVRGTLLIHRSVSYANTDVSVKDGNVTLTGKASSEAQRQLTSEYAKDVSGVKDVDNKMTVTEEPAQLQRSPGEVIDDASITTQVKMSLLFHHGTDAFDTKVSTNNGIVTLSGKAKNQAEIDLATKRVSDINGVKSVTNKMTVEESRSSTN
jgi:osmotically-inducible protein OsmY